MTFCYYIVSQTQTQTGTLSCWLSGKERLKYFVQNFLRNTIAIVLHFDLDLPIFFFCSYCNRWIITVLVLFLLFINHIKCIIDQVQNDSSNILWYNIYFSNVIIKISF